MGITSNEFIDIMNTIWHVKDEKIEEISFRDLFELLKLKEMSIKTPELAFKYEPYGAKSFKIHYQKQHKWKMDGMAIARVWRIRFAESLRASAQGGRS